ncbi:MAG: hypothetical protein OSJ72_13710 [Lachnospiraceae bacterium]|nr:hypothetical protein [Lachnospiraceae bacterium]
MSDRERAIQLLEAVPDYKIEYVIAYLQGMIVGEKTPNDETLEAFREVDEMKKDGKGQHFSGSTGEFLNTLLED